LWTKQKEETLRAIVIVRKRRLARRSDEGFCLSKRGTHQRDLGII